MLVIREAQIVALSRALRSRFERESLGHVKACFPEQCAELGEENAFHYVQQGLRRAKDYGFESQYDLLRFLNVMFTLGADFDQSELHSWMRPILMGRDMAPSTRMDFLLHELHSRLSPGHQSDGSDSPYESAGAEVNGSREFDGIIWEDGGDPNYVPQSIAPTILPYERGPAPGSVILPAIEEVVTPDEDSVLMSEGEDRGWE